MPVVDPAAYIPLARSLAWPVVHRCTDPGTRDDLMAQAMLGLVVAASNYDPARDVKFKTYARRIIVGHIYDHVRSLYRWRRPSPIRADLQHYWPDSSADLDFRLFEAIADDPTGAILAAIAPAAARPPKRGRPPGSPTRPNLEARP